MAKINNIIMVLGKRLINNRLTQQGKARVEWLLQHLNQFNPEHTLIMFCGGLTHDQHISEAQAMADFFNEQLVVRDMHWPLNRWCLEDNSTSSVENFYFAAKVLTQHPDVKPDALPLHITLLSNDYHLERILSIQRYLPEQGLVRFLQMELAAHSIQAQVSLRRQDHLSVDYGYHSNQATLFLCVEQLTPFRVYLEGVLHGNIDNQNAHLGQFMLEEAKQTVQAMLMLIAENPELKFADKDVNRVYQSLEAIDIPIAVDALAFALQRFQRPLEKLRLACDPDQKS